MSPEMEFVEGFIKKLSEEFEKFSNSTKTHIADAEVHHRVLALPVMVAFLRKAEEEFRALYGKTEFPNIEPVLKELEDMTYNQIQFANVDQVTLLKLPPASEQAS